MVSLALAALLAAPVLLTGEDVFVLDLNATPAITSSGVATHRYGFEGEVPGFATDGNGWYYFTAATPVFGEELYATNGEVANTFLVKDIAPGPASSAPRELVGAAGRVFFTRKGAADAHELWVSDASVPGTYKVFEANLIGGDDRVFGDRVALGGSLIFSLRDAAQGREPWVSDGTPAGTFALGDLMTAGDSDPRRFHVSADGSAAYFFADVDGASEPQLCRTDGSPAGTSVVAHLGLGADFQIGPMANAGALTYLSVKPQGTSSPAELWVTDGTPLGTQHLMDFQDDGLDLGEAIDQAGQLWFVAAGLGDEQRIWASDGTPAGTLPLTTVTSLSKVTGLTALNAGGLFVGQTTPLGLGLMRVTPTGKVVIVLSFTGIGGFESFGDFSQLGGSTYLLGAPTKNAELWVTDGSPQGTGQYHDFEPNGSSKPSDLTRTVNDKLILIATTQTEGRELRLVDPVANTVDVVDLDAGLGSLGSNPEGLTAIGSKRLFFSADFGGTGREPYYWSQATGVVALGDLNPGPGGSEPSEFTRLWTGSEELVVFRASATGGPPRPWVTDGTPAGTFELGALTYGAALPVDAGSPLGFDFIEVGNRIVFGADDGGLGRELWATDGTLAGTQKIQSGAVGGPAPQPRLLRRFGDRVVYAADGLTPAGLLPLGLWITDGTAAGTERLFASDPFFPMFMTAPSAIVVADGRIYFGGLFEDATAPGVVERRVVVTDGSLAGTQVLEATPLAQVPSVPFSEYTVFDGDFHYVAVEAGGIQAKLMRVRGSTLTTQTLGQIQVYSAPANRELESSARGLYFLGSVFLGGNEWTGPELHTSDGTPGGTHLVADLVPWGFEAPAEFTPVGGGLYFVADDGVHGRELQFSDGDDIELVCDLIFGPTYSKPSDLVLLGDQLVFAADVWSSGRELCFLPIQDAHVTQLGAGLDITLQASHPFLGMTSTIRSLGISPLEPSALLWSLPTLKPSSDRMLPGYGLWLDPFSATVIKGFAGGDWQTQVAVPSAPSLAGLTVHLQALTAPPSTPLLRSSNGLALTLGL